MKNGYLDGPDWSSLSRVPISGSLWDSGTYSNDFQLVIKYRACTDNYDAEFETRHVFPDEKQSPALNQFMTRDDGQALDDLQVEGLVSELEATCVGFWMSLDKHSPSIPDKGEKR